MTAGHKLIVDILLKDPCPFGDTSHWFSQLRDEGKYEIFFCVRCLWQIRIERNIQIGEDATAKQ